MARTTIQRQLLDAYNARVKRDGLTLDQLLRLADLACSPDSLSRKLRGKQAMRTGEAEKLAVALSIEVSAGKSVAAA